MSFLITKRAFYTHGYTIYSNRSCSLFMEDLSIRNAISTILSIPGEAITNLAALKSGMTNNSYIFTVNKTRYIIRIPGKNTNKIINRYEEFQVYQAIKPWDLSEEIIYLCAETGIKISKFIEASHTLDVTNWDDVSHCLDTLKKLHDLNLVIPHTFDIFERINYYESLIPNKHSRFDYKAVKSAVFSLKSLIEKSDRKWCLCHIDAVCDNFILTNNNKVYLIDFEYEGMQDTDLDLAMCSVYSMLDRPSIDRVINLYYKQQVNAVRKYKIYAYIALAGLLWSNWCEAKQDKGLIYSTYAHKQYRYAKEYSRIIMSEAVHLIESDKAVQNYG